ncbi:MAG: hypothetical protein GY724_28185 [Actinomycetia bacterium]|nr:hypothetical protein [Actinomycetes bacterium]MCP4223615.1 hypothetical protein [Actinomycetes bacterium]MCP5033702.1 hypothetical protein [Actinomycetes bacterium]
MAYPTNMVISDERLAEMQRAIELQVDVDDFEVRSLAERHLWNELEVEFELRCQREGPSWVAEAA